MMKFSIFQSIRRVKYCGVRYLHELAEPGCGVYKRGLVLGVNYFNDGQHDHHIFTPAAEKYNEMVCNRLEDLLWRSGSVPRLGQFRVFYDLDPYYNAVALVGIGLECKGYNKIELIDESKEAIRIASGLGTRILQKLGMQRIAVESFEHTESAAEGAALALWLYQEFKNKTDYKDIPTLDLWQDCDWDGWEIGLHKASAQNFARELCATPANHMTPVKFSQTAVEACCKTGINCEVRVRRWAETEGMGAFLAAAKGSCQTPLFLELSYQGSNNPKERPVVLVGKGITFNSGGTCLGSPAEIKYGRGEMSGAACVLATCGAIASMNLEINVRGLIPLCENLPSCTAMKPGDVAVAMNGKSILIKDTSCCGRLMMADALVYAQKYWPKFILDVGTMTKGIRYGISTSATGVFTNSDRLWEQLSISAAHTGDRVWRFPLYNIYNKMMDSEAFDVSNVGRDIQGADCCKCAAFLKHFVPCGEWIHLDNFNTNISLDKSDPPYYRRGFSGRPTRTIVEFVSQCLCKH